MHCFFQLLCVRTGGRINSVEELKKVQCLQHINLESVLEKRIKPSFTPPVSWLMLYDIFICFVLSTLGATKCRLGFLASNQTEHFTVQSHITFISLNLTIYSLIP